MAYDYYYQDPSQGWYGDNPYDQYEEQPYEEDTESQKLKKEQDLIEAIESNRLYLRKVRKRCVQEDFADLEKTQMFLFEFLIESLEVNKKSELGLVPEDPEETGELVARVQFQDTPYLEIREKGEKMQGSDSVLGHTEYFETVGNAGLQDAVDPVKTTARRTDSVGGSIKEKEPEEATGEQPPSVQYDTMWENPSGKSLLFSKSALDIIHGLEKSPVKVQVSTCIEPTEEDGVGTCEPLGYALIRLPDHFSLSVIQSCKPGVILPVSCVHRDTCELRNVFGVKKGEMQVFIRLSCFGNVITTSFQSVGPDRRYVFKPSPLPEMPGTEEADLNRDTILKPMIAEEEVAKGINMIKDEDPFQKTVLWKNNTQNCGCLEMPTNDMSTTEPSLRMPRPSDASLCRDAAPPHGKQGKPYCDWHDLVRKGIKNSPGGNCGCLDGEASLADYEEWNVGPPASSKKCCHEKPLSILEEMSMNSRDRDLMPSRIQKIALKTNENEKPMKTKAESRLVAPKNENRAKKTQPGDPVMLPRVPEKALKPVVGIGIPPEPTHCECDCAQIRNSLAVSPMMKYTWQVK